MPTPLGLNQMGVGEVGEGQVLTERPANLMEEAAEIARLRLFLALVAPAQSVDDLEPLPNIGP